jgi:hypothetical protein
MYAREIWRAFIKIKEIFLFYDPHEFSTTCELPVVLSQIRTSMPGSTEIKSVSTGEAFSGRFADSSTTSSAGFEFWDEFWSSVEVLTESKTGKAAAASTASRGFCKDKRLGIIKCFFSERWNDVVASPTDIGF